MCIHRTTQKDPLIRMRVALKYQMDGLYTYVELKGPHTRELQVESTKLIIVIDSYSR